MKRSRRTRGETNSYSSHCIVWILDALVGLVGCLPDDVFQSDGNAGLLVFAGCVETAAGRELLVGVGAGDLEYAHAAVFELAQARSRLGGNLLGTGLGVGRSAADQLQFQTVQTAVIVVGLGGFDLDTLGKQR